MKAAALDRTREFEASRPRLRAIAYRMLGSIEDAEDVVQETFVRWHSTAREEISSPAAWLTAVCTRLSIDTLRAAYRKREQYVGPWLPEPVVSDRAELPSDPAELANSLSVAFLLMLERLSPLERAAFLLHDIFDYPYPDVARILQRSEAACRQLASRARRNVRSEDVRFTAPPEQATWLLERFLAAARAGEIHELTSMLTADVELWTDGGGEAQAARNVVRGPEPVARFLIGVARKGEGALLHSVFVNGAPGVLFSRDGSVGGSLSLALDSDGGIRKVFIVVNPTKLKRIRLPQASPLE